MKKLLIIFLMLMLHEPIMHAEPDLYSDFEKIIIEYDSSYRDMTWSEKAHMRLIYSYSYDKRIRNLIKKQ